MRLVGPQDVPVFLGLLVALLLAFLNPLARLVGTPSSLIGQIALAVVPGLALMAGVLAFDRRRSRSVRVAADSEAESFVRVAESRGVEFDRFVSFTRALAKAVDADGVTAAIESYLTSVAGTAGVSVLLNAPTGWEVYAGDRTAGDEILARADGANDALTTAPAGTATSVDASASGPDVSFSLRVLGQPIGVLVVRRARRDLSPETLRVLEGAAAVLAVTIKNLQLVRDLQETSLRDPLTGCFSRAHGLEMIDSELRRARRSQSPISLLLIDIDHLKDINGRHGYQCGDAVLGMVGRRLREVLRRSDLKCRYGGEEFVILLPETALVGARRVAETLRREIADRPMPWNGDTITVTASLGVTQVLPSEVNVDAIIGRAETAVCRAQEEGHNTVRVASDGLVSLDKGRRQE